MAKPKGKKTETPEARARRLTVTRLARTMWALDTKETDKEARKADWEASQKDRLQVARALVKGLEKRGVAFTINPKVKEGEPEEVAEEA